MRTILRRTFELSIISILSLSLFVGCSKKSPADKIIGKWSMDLTSLKKDPKVAKMLKAQPGMGAFLDVLGNTKFEFTKDTLTVSMGGGGMPEKNETIKYKVSSSKDNYIEIEALDGKDKGNKLQVTIIDEKHIKVVDPSKKKDPPFYLKRV